MDKLVADLLADASFREWALGDDRSAQSDWDARVAASSRLAEAAAEARAILRDLDGAYRLPDEDRATDAAYAEFRRRLRQRRRPSSGRVPSRPRRRRLYQRPIAWACALVAVGLFAFFFGLGAPGPAPQRYATGAGELMEVSLPDGSTVTLDNHSVLVVDPWVEGAPRRVALERGTAFFDVRRSDPPGRAFVVHARGVDVEVLGTEFSVAAEDSVEVVLASGEVDVHFPSRPGRGPTSVRLAPGEAVTDDFARAPRAREVSDLGSELLWRRGLARFEDADLAIVTAALGEVYDVRFELSARARATGPMRASLPTDSLPEALQILGFLLDGEGVTVRTEGTPVTAVIIE